MKRILPPVACAAAILLSSVAIEAIASPAFAQMDDQVGFQTFHDVLAQSGDWVYSDRWGEVWIPTDVADDFQPYGSNGYWADSEYGWTWVSGYDWGDIPFHYGRWVNDPDDGWLWIPGYVWSPAWVGVALQWPLCRLDGDAAGSGVSGRAVRRSGFPLAAA